MTASQIVALVVALICACGAGWSLYLGAGRWQHSRQTTGGADTAPKSGASSFFVLSAALFLVAVVLAVIVFANADFMQPIRLPHPFT